MLYEIVFDGIHFNKSIQYEIEKILGSSAMLFNTSNDKRYFDKITFESNILGDSWFKRDRKHVNVYNLYYEIISLLDKIIIYGEYVLDKKYFEITLKEFYKNLVIIDKIYYIKNGNIIER